MSFIKCYRKIPGIFFLLLFIGHFCFSNYIIEREGKNFLDDMTWIVGTAFACVILTAIRMDFFSDPD